MRQNKHSAKEQAGPPASSWWRQDGLLGFMLMAVTFLAYQPVWHAGFIWDDDTFLTDNPVIKSADGLYRMWFTTSTPDYFPVTSSLLWLEWRIWGSHPLGYHLINVLLHAASAVLLWRVLQRLKIPGALLAAALFALHPVNVESVAWITERKNTLAMFFYAGTLLCWLKFEDSGRGRWYGLALAGFALGLLSKTAVAPLPVVLLGMAWWRRGRVGWKDVWRAVPFFVMAAVLALVTVWFQYHKAINHEVVRTDGFWSRLAGAGWAVWFYLYKAVLPVNLAFVYPRWQIDARNVLSYIPLVLWAAALVLCWRKSRALFFGLAYFVVMLLPILGFLNIYFMRYSLVADHWEYFAIIGPIALVAAILRKPVVGVALLLALGALTWKQCGMYANAETLWETTLQRDPDSWMARCNLGIILDNKGGVDEAIVQFTRVLEIKPDYVEARNNLGNALLKKNRVDEAIDQFQKALQSNASSAAAHYDFGNALRQKGSLNEAISRYQEALQINPDYVEAHLNLGNILLQTGRADEAITHFQQALQIKPDSADAHFNFGNALRQMGRPDEAIVQYQAALQIDPGHVGAHINLGTAFGQKRRVAEAITQFQQALQIEPANIEAQNNLAWTLATCAEASLRNGERALQLARQANEQSGGKNPVILHTLAAAFAETGRFDDAAQNAQQAIALAQSAGRQDLAERFNSELKRYKAGLPCRQ